MVSFKQSIVRFFKGYFDIAGRSTRAEYWWVVLAFSPFYIFDLFSPFVPSLYTIILLLVTAVPLTSLIVRRCNDVGPPMWLGFILLSSIFGGWFMFGITGNGNILILATVGSIALFIISVLPSRKA